MKKIIITLTLSITYIFGLNAVVSITPEQEFLQAIGGDRVNISLMVKAGDSPHTYEPKPSQMIALSKADIYFAIGVEFEKAWLPKFKNLNPTMDIIDISQGVVKMTMEKDNHDEEEEEHHDEHEHQGDDPHIWTSIANIKLMATNIYTALSQKEPQNQDYFRANLDKYLLSLEQKDKEIRDILSSIKGDRVFMVFHPSWGYFARDYNLTQLSVEIEGKEPKPKELIHLLKEAKAKGVKAIFTQPEFSDTVSIVIAKELNIPVVKVTPLSAQCSQNLINIAKTIAQSE